jgi:hypothetical protein
VWPEKLPGHGQANGRRPGERQPAAKLSAGRGTKVFDELANLMAHWIDPMDDIETVSESIRRNCPLKFDAIMTAELARMTLRAAKLATRSYH